MPRRPFVLLVLVILTGLWTPPQRATAQSECPEGGCKVFLPVVQKRAYVEVTHWWWQVYRECDSHIAVSVRNVSQQLVTGYQLSGHVVFEDGAEFDYNGLNFDGTFYPGASGGFFLDIPEPQLRGCVPPITADFQVSNIVVANQVFYQLSVLSKNVEGICRNINFEPTTWTVSGKLRNDTSFRLTNLVLKVAGVGPYTIVDLPQTLEPGETMSYKAQFSYPCGWQNPIVLLDAWGEYSP